MAGVNNASSYWTLTLARYNSANSGTTIVSFSTSSDAGLTWVSRDQIINTVLDASARQLQITVTKVGSPANLYAPSILYFRRIVT